MYYELVGESRNSYTRLLFLNEMVSGQNADYIDALFRREREEPLRFDQNNCRVCLTGLRKAVYSGRYGASTNDYMRIYVLFERGMREFMERNGYTGEIFLHLYADKRIIMIYSQVREGAVPYDRIAQEAQDRLQAMYEEAFLHDGVYVNQTYLSEEKTTRETLAATLSSLIDLSKLNFFLMEPVVLTSEKIRAARAIPSESDIRELRQAVVAATGLGDLAECGGLLGELMLNRIKYSFNRYLLEDVALLFKRFYLQCCSAYDIPVDEDADAVFDAASHPSIETFTAALSRKFEECVRFIHLRAERYGRLTQKALRIIKTGFCKRDISLTYVAEQINVSPAYLSSLFNREVGMSISTYITDLRMEKAKELLEKTDLLVAEISKTVGFENKRYFAEVFKRKTGMIPTEYRDSRREAV